MIGLFYGTRPEYIKLQPLLTALDRKDVDYLLYQVAQHTDLIDGCVSDIVIDVTPSVGNRLNSIFTSVMSHNLESLDYALVQGDTTTATAVAMSAFHQNIPVMHLEAGMRTYDKKNPFPEEVNRRIISSLASIHYCPTESERDYLVTEGYSKDSILVTGNTAIDNLQGLESSESNRVLITLHRRENHASMGKWFETIDQIAKNNPDYEFVFPMHPNPNVQAHKAKLKSVKVLEPLLYFDMREQIASCAAIITDSGGIQEEASFFRKPCFVCRTTTERPCEGSVLCEAPEDLLQSFDVNKEVTVPTRFGDGRTGERVAEDISSRMA